MGRRSRFTLDSRLLLLAADARAGLDCRGRARHEPQRRRTIMPTELVKIADNHANWVNWGKLVKTWATGNNYLNDQQDYTIPQSLDAFRAQLTQANVSMTIPAWVEQIQFIMDDGKTLTVRLPSKGMIEDAEAHLKAITDANRLAVYPLPQFYGAECWGVQPQNAFNLHTMLEFHCERIGEYTINNCI